MLTKAEKEKIYKQGLELIEFQNKQDGKQNEKEI